MKEVRIVIASPSDVGPERDAVESVCLELNRNLGRPKGTRLETYRWETDSRPGFHIGGPQGLIDDQLKIVDCDLLVAIFWKRFGSPITTGPETGTEHEIALAYSAWVTGNKPDIAVYFKEQPFFTASVSDTEQVLLVNRFRHEFRKGGKYEKGSYGTFTDTLDFERQIQRHLTRLLMGL